MKHAVALAWSTCTIVVVALIVLLGMNLTVWSGPNLDISAKGSEAKVESVFLGEYELASQGFESRVMTRVRLLSI